MFTGTPLPGNYLTKSIPKRDLGRTRRSGELLLEELDKRMSLGKRQGMRKDEGVWIGGFI